MFSTEIFIPVVIMSILGGAFALLIGVVSQLTHIDVDPRVIQIREALPGANCGACGYPGCDGCAVAIAKGEAPISACVVGGAASTEKIADIMGGSAEIGQRYVASVKCQGDCEHTQKLFAYHGIQDCRIMAKQRGGNKSCLYGCLGCGTCQSVCNFGAIQMVNGVAVINEEKCTQCMQCINICPKHIIELVPYHAPAQVKCHNPEFGKDVKTACTIGCIGCGICHRLAPEEFNLDGKLAHATYHDAFDMEKAQAAAAKCPSKCIVINAEGDVNAKPLPSEEKEAAVQ
ncbi:RnfABCDGE type electron transport complex subunit B [Levyella massiliensis]|uniref:RnfABCDGE type electron transport complex subunit B n=1 Tax=Levyella massiliensis TaxID=938289 RepID=UPI000368E60F|nr:RnfABCDGE type electron transport complex subunit B [Levyella massiliensis]